MASATGPLLKLTTMAIASNTTLFTTKPSYPFLSFPSKPIKFLLSSTFSSSLTLTKKISSSSLTPQVATSDYPQQEEEVEVEGVDLEAEESEGEDGGEESYPEPPEEAKLFVGNLPYDIDSEKLAQLFDEAGVVEISEVIYNRETEQSRGFGFVTMSTVEQAEKAVEMFNRYEVNGRSLTVNKAAPRGSRAERPPRTIDSALRVYVGNLPWQVDDAQLEQVFSEYGKVVDSKVVFDRETGRSRGFGFVTMSSQSEVNDAIAGLDGQSMEGRSIRVNVAEDRPRRTSY